MAGSRYFYMGNLSEVMFFYGPNPDGDAPVALQRHWSSDPQPDVTGVANEYLKMLSDDEYLAMLRSLMKLAWRGAVRKLDSPLAATGALASFKESTDGCVDGENRKKKLFFFCKRIFYKTFFTIVVNLLQL